MNVANRVKRIITKKRFYTINCVAFRQLHRDNKASNFYKKSRDVILTQLSENVEEWKSERVKQRLDWKSRSKGVS